MLAVILSDGSEAMGVEGPAAAFRVRAPPQNNGCPILNAYFAFRVGQHDLIDSALSS